MDTHQKSNQSAGEKHILILSDFVGCGNVAMATSRAVLTRLGHRAYCLPTALISNTWNLGPCAQLDTTSYLRASLENWQRLGIRLDGVLLGYLADENQARWLGEQCEAWHRAGVKLFFDPIFADNGKLYRGITRQHLEFLKGMLPQMDYVLPNLTEARFLAGETDPVRALAGLLALGAGTVVITGVPWEEECAVLLGSGGEISPLPYTPIPGSFSGAGDAFSALFTGFVLAGLPAEESARKASDTTKQWLRRSLDESWQGVGLPVERYF